MIEIELPKNWHKKKLNEISKILPGYGFPLNFQGNKTGKYPFYKVGDISRNVQKGNRYLNFCENFITDNDLNLLKAKLFPKNTIVFAKIGEALKLNRRALINIEGLVDNNAVGVKANEEYCLDKYLYYFFTTIKLENYSRATTVPSVRKSDLEEIKIPLPPLETQHAIVSKIEELFSELDQGIADLKTAQAQLKVYRQSVLKHAFEGKLTNKNVKEGELPEGWEIKTFSDVLDISKEKYKPNNNESRFYVGLEHIEKNIGSLTPECGVEIIKTLKNQFNKGEILYGKLRPYLNKVYLAKESGVCSTDILVLKTKDNCNAQFLTHLMLGVDFVNTMSENTSGVNLPRVSTKFILEYPIKLPPIEEQHLIVQEIESRLSVADKMEESIQESLQKAEALRQSILKKAFSGELV